MRVWFASALVLLASVLPAGARAAIEITPISLTLSETQRVGAFTIRNDAATPVTVQARAFGWTQDGSENRRVPTDLPLIVPPIFTIPGFGQQVVRFGLRQLAATALEQNYRVLFSQIAGATSVNAGVAINFAFDIPVFIAPSGRRYSDLVFTLQGSGRHVQLRAQNTGTMHKQVRTLRLVSPAGANVATISGAGYVLAGASQTWPIDIPPGARPVTVEVDAVDGPGRYSLSPSP